MNYYVLVNGGQGELYVLLFLLGIAVGCWPVRARQDEIDYLET